MKNIEYFLDSLSKRFFSSTNQIQRIVVLVAIALGLAIVSFGGYYYYDRYYVSQPKVAEMTVVQAEQAVRDDPQNLDKRMALAEAYLVTSRFEEAIVQANQVLAARPDEQRAWLVVGVASAISGKPADAIEPLTQYVNANKDKEMAALDKTLRSAAYYLGDSYLQLGRPQDAIEPLELTVGWSQTDADAMYKLGLAYAATDQHDKALVVFHSAAAFVPNYLEVYQAMADSYDANGQSDLADYARAMVTYSKKDYNSALSALLKVSQAHPDFAPAFTGLGLSYEALGDLQNAKASYEVAAQLNPEDFTATQGVLRTEAALKK